MQSSEYLHLGIISNLLQDVGQWTRGYCEKEKREEEAFRFGSIVIKNCVHFWARIFRITLIIKFSLELTLSFQNCIVIFGLRTSSNNKSLDQAQSMPTILFCKA